MPTIRVKSGEARAKFREMLDRVLSGQGDVIIERNGKSVAVMIPAADYEQFRANLDEFRAVREAAARYEAWKNDPSLGRLWDEVDAELDREE